MCVPLLLAATTAAIFDPDAFSPILPLPLEQRNGSSELLVLPNLTWTLGKGAADSEVLRAAVARYRSLIFAWGRAGSGSHAVDGRLSTMHVSVGNPADDASALQLGMDESYRLDVKREHATLAANTVWGALRGLETFSQLVTWEAECDSYVLRWAPWHIEDAPRFPVRGVLLDTARHYISVDAIKRQIDALAYVKMNVLHWHAVDEQSFPLVSERFPSLSAAGAFAPKAVYTPDQVSDIVTYARFRGVRVLLELDMPGHSTAWSLGAPSHLFIHCPGGAAGDFDGDHAMLDPTLEDTYNFVELLLAETASRFPDAALHLGGDEVDTSCWNTSASVRAWLAARPGTTLDDLFVAFELRVHAIAQKLGRHVVTWADVYLAAAARNTSLPPSATVQVWGKQPTLTQVVRSGHRVVRSTGYYLSVGFSTGGCASVWETLYNDDPMPEGLSEAEQRLVLGAEAAMWGEVTDEYFLDQKLWLRASVLAERLWSANETIASRVSPWPASYTSPDINARLVRHRCRLLQRGVRAQPYSTIAVPLRSRWSQCELWLPSCLVTRAAVQVVK